MITIILIIITLCGKFPRLEYFLSWFRALELVILWIIWEIIEKQTLFGMIIVSLMAILCVAVFFNFCIQNSRKYYKKTI
jgi:chromate transport protein ChrA